MRAFRSIELANPSLTVTRKNVIASMIAHIAAETFDNREHAELWIALLGVESSYDGRARSNKGAVGLGQLLPKYAKDFGADCGLIDANAADVADDYTNAVLSACYFRSLVRLNNNSADLAMVAYISGNNSKDHAKAAAGQKPGKDAADYVKRIHEKAANVQLVH